MGGPRAWKGMQKNRNGWNDGDGGDDVAPDRSKDTDEEASDEDVSTTTKPNAYGVFLTLQNDRLKL
jgi:hypothetical protein